MEDNMRIDLHSEAKKNINEKCNNLLLKLLPKKDEFSNNIKPFKSDIPTITLDPNKIKINSLNTVDLSGNTVERFFKYKDQLIGLNIVNYKELQRLIDEIFKKREINNSVKKEFLEDQIFFWFESMYKGELNIEFTEFLIDVINNSIKEFDIWIPIAFTEIESSFTFGGVTFRELTKEIIDKSYNEFISKSDEVFKGNCKHILEKIIEKFQGKAIALISVIAEKTRAVEIAYEKAEQAITLLRFFHISSTNPLAVSYSTLYGLKKPKSKNILFIKEGIITNYNSGFIERFNLWRISKSEINKFKKMGFDILSDLIQRERNEFQNKLVDALLLFSKCSIINDFSEKLITIFVALESIFIKDSEPILYNLADRICFLISDEITERLKIIKTIKDTYQLRSKFIHHGKNVDVDDIDLFTEFMRIIWYCFHCLLCLSQNIEINTLEKFFNYIEQRKYS